MSEFYFKHDINSMPWKVGLERKSNGSGHVPISEIVIRNLAQTQTPKLHN
jgi:hypothetical protein